jgi:hypothetical protein
MIRVVSERQRNQGDAVAVTIVSSPLFDVNENLLWFGKEIEL